VNRSDTETLSNSAKQSCFARKTNDLGPASSCADALSPRGARFTKWIIFKHKIFSGARERDFFVDAR